MSKLLHCIATVSLTSGLSLAFAPLAHSQIAVQGGNFSGDGAFFVPDAANAARTTLFDAAIRNLNLRTSNGVTNTSVFLPSASSYNAQGRIPSAGDTGTLQGTLAGIAFTRSGIPIGFSGVPTSLDFTLTSYNHAGGLIGILVPPKPSVNASPLYFPVRDVKLDASSTPYYNTPVSGVLDVGTFTASVSGGQIALPSSLQFLPLSGVSVPQIFLGQPTFFAFSGVKRLTNTVPGQVTATDFNPLDGSLSLQADGDATNTVLDVAFTVQVAGAPPISGYADGVRFGVQGVNSFLQVGSLSETPGTVTRFQISGTGIGVSSLVNNTTLGYASPHAVTNFDFQQSTGRLQGTSSGSALLRLGTLEPKTGFVVSVQGGAVPFQPEPNQSPNPPSPPNIPNQTPNFNTSNPSLPSNGNNSSTNNQESFSTTDTTSMDVIRRVSTLFTVSSIEDVTYQIFSTEVVQVSIERGKGQSTLYVSRGVNGQVVGAYVQMGPSSSIFPGLQGLQPIASADVPDSTTPANQTPTTPANQTPTTPANQTPTTPANQTPTTPANQTPTTPANQTPTTPPGPAPAPQPPNQPPSDLVPIPHE